MTRTRRWIPALVVLAAAFAAPAASALESWSDAASCCSPSASASPRWRAEADRADLARPDARGEGRRVRGLPLRLRHHEGPRDSRQPRRHRAAPRRRPADGVPGHLDLGVDRRRPALRRKGLPEGRHPGPRPRVSDRGRAHRAPLRRSRRRSASARRRKARRPSPSPAPALRFALISTAISSGRGFTKSRRMRPSARLRDGRRDRRWRSGTSPRRKHDGVARPAEAAVEDELVALQAVALLVRVRLGDPQPDERPFATGGKPDHDDLRVRLHRLADVEASRA